MKILTKEEEEAHYNATLKGGITGGLIGIAVGGSAVFAAHKRFPTFRSLTLPLKTFLVTSSGTFAAIIQADRSSRSYEFARDPQRQYRDEASMELDAIRDKETSFQRFKEWGREHRYPIVTVSWVASMAIALGIVGRSPYLTGAQKLVQARVYAQGLTLAVLIATAAFEVGDANKGKGRWETVKVLDPNDPEHKHIIEKRIHHEAYQGEDLWRDMVATEERKMAAQKKAKEEQLKSPGTQTHPNEAATKSKIVSESKSAGKVDFKEAAERERKNQ
ncbi:Respiratory supercomplex factor 2-like protein [Lachnellula hyalina]|uniref:Respiratory supercomplex factor 2-like protein n=1 Tax=Lachnellula hyalina TaxID=1316788 RepID=A0A8H8U1F8_9HELO|nr:Respiratory supercomplex factor 2-like protein [Lachnellula hyalina]TVY29998.1 Respiratory supercomplex factor 2-like protein [Lachnellula hyalina]